MGPRQFLHRLGRRVVAGQRSHHTRRSICRHVARPFQNHQQRQCLDGFQLWYGEFRPASRSTLFSPNTVYACQSLNLYKSTDGAKTWKSIRAEGCAVVAADPKTEGIVWQGFGFDFPIVTLDGGGTFFGTYGKVVTNAIAIPRGIGK